MPQLRGKQLSSAVAGNGLTQDGSGNLAIDTTTDSVTFTSAVWTFPTDSLQVTGTPNSDNDGVNLKTVNLLDFKNSVRAATTTALPTVTYNNGTAGVGATLTASAVGILTVDTVATVLGDRLLIKDEANAAHHGIYTVTTEGTVSVAFVLTRAIDNDEGSEQAGAVTYVEDGSINVKAFLVNEKTGTITMGTSLMNWKRFATAGEDLKFKTVSADFGSSSVADTATDVLTLTGGDGITTTSTGVADTITFDIDLASVSGLEFSAGELRIDAENDSLVLSASGIKSAVPVDNNKNMTALVTSSDNDQGTATALVATPGGDSYVRAYVNGVAVQVGDGTKVGVESYFSGDAGATARSISAIASGDTWHWNGSVSGFQLDTSDKIDFDYVNTTP